MATTASPPLPSSALPTSTAPTMKTEPPRKKPRLGGLAVAEIATQEMEDLETSLEVDHMILDYLLYQSIEACLANPHTAWDNHVSRVESTLLEVDEFYALFRQRYPAYRLDAQIQFRRDLLQFAALFTQRLKRNSTTPGKASLQRLRESNRTRAIQWIMDEQRQPTSRFDCTLLDSKLPMEASEYERARARTLQEIGVPAEDDAYEDAFYGTSESVSLLDTLPLFMKISASCHALFDVAVNPQWMTIAIAFMLQACLEQYLVYGQDGSDAIDEAFAWGYKTPEEGGTEESTDPINAMFEDDGNGREVPGWQEAKDAALKDMLSWKDDKLARHLRRLHDTESLVQCETNVMTFLKDISQGIAKPVLLQLEQGQLDGMTHDETQSFIRDCGVDVEAFLARPAAAAAI